MKSPGTLSIVFGVLFLLPFCAVGLIALVQSVIQLADGEWEQGGFLLIFGIAFGGAGFGALAALFFGRRLAKKQEELQLRYPDAPWKWREDWAEGNIRSAGLPAVWASWVFAVIWNAVSSSVVLFLPQMLEENKLPALLALIFPLVGLWLIYRAVRLTIQRRRFGESVLRLDTLPALTGGRLAGTLSIPAGFPPDAKLLLRLTCVHRQRSTGRNNSTTESIVWQEELPPASVYSAGGSVAIPFAFAIPPDARPSNASGGGTGILWRLSGSAQVPGVDFGADFEVPVFSGPPGARIAAQPEAFPEALPEHVQAATGSIDAGGSLPEGVTVRPTPDGGAELVMHRWRNGRVALGIAAFTVLWTAVIAVMIVAGAPLFFPVVFGLFDLLLIWFIIHMWAGETRVTIDRAGVTIHPRLPVLSSATVLPPGRFSDVRLGIGMQSGNAVFYNLDLAGGTGKPVTIQAFLRNKRDAERVACVMKQALVSTHNVRTGQ